MKDHLVRFAVYAEWIKHYYQVSTPVSERLAREKAILVEIKDVLYARVPHHRFELYKRMMKKWNGSKSRAKSS